MKTITEFYLKGIDQLKQEMESFKDSKLIWLTKGSISNSSGNLCLHLIGNLNHFIGARMGATNYQRQRDLEFSSKDIPLEQLLSQLKETRSVVESVLNSKSEAWLQEEFPDEFFGEKRSNEFMLFQLLAHLNYHVGQINYLRRSLE